MILNLKERIARILAHTWIIVVLWYVIRRLNVSVLHKSILPTASPTLIYNIGMSICWFGILSMPSFLLLMLTKESVDAGNKIVKYGFTILFIVALILFVLWFFFK